MAESSKSKRAAAQAPKAKKSQAKSSPKKSSRPVAAQATPPKSAAKSEVVMHQTSSGPSKPAFSFNFSSYLGKLRAGVTNPTVWKWIGGTVAVIALLLVAWWQWQRSYVAVVNGQYVPTTKLYSQLLANNGSQTLETLTQQQLILQEADKRNVEVSDDKVQAELDTFIESTGGEAAYRNSLREYGISEELLHNQIEVRLTLEALLGDKIKVSDKEVEDYYNANKAELDPENKGIDSVKKSIETQLKEQKLNQESSKLIESLSQNAQMSQELNNASLTFVDFLQAEVFTIPTDVWNLVSGGNTTK